MSEELEAGAAPAESVDAAPAEAVTADVAPAETVEPVPEEAVSPADPSLTADEEAVEAAPVSFPSADDFAWDDWQGDMTALPEELQGWGTRFGKYYDARIARIEASANRNKEVYDALLNNKADPRLQELQTSVAQWEDKYNGLYGQFEYLDKEYKAYQKEVADALEEEASAYAEEFAAANTDLFENEARANTFADLLDDGWMLEHAAVAARLPKDVLDVARQAKADGVPDTYALKLAQGAKSKPATPRPGAKLTSGAVTPVRSSEQVELKSDAPMSLDQFRKQVARNALSIKRR